MLLCKDCKWCEVRQFPMCFHQKAAITVTDYFNGATNLQYPSAQTARTIGECRPEGVLFEPIPVR